MSIFDGMIAAEEKKLAAKYAPQIAEVSKLVAEVKEIAAPFLTEITPEEEAAALQFLFPKKTSAQIASLVVGLNKLASVEAEIESIASAVEKKL